MKRPLILTLLLCLPLAAISWLIWYSLSDRHAVGVPEVQAPGTTLSRETDPASVVDAGGRNGPSKAPHPALLSAAEQEAMARADYEAIAFRVPPQPDRAKLDAFSDWTRRWTKADAQGREALREEGARLARERRPEFKALIVVDPREALKQAVPRVVRQDLPAEIVDSLEKPIAMTGDFTLYRGLPAPGLPKPTQKLESRIFDARDGASYTAHVFGEMEAVTWKKQMPLSGVAVDLELAVAENPVRRLEAGERIPKGTKVEETCPVSGQTTVAVANGEAVPENVPTVEIGERVITLCNGSHVTVLEDQYRTKIQASGPGGAGVFLDSFPGTSSKAIGNFRCLYIPVTYPDQLAAPITEDGAYGDMQNVGRFFLEGSYGKLTTTTVVTPLVTLANSLSWFYTAGNLGLIHSQARTAAYRLGYDPGQYDCVIVRVNGGPSMNGVSWGGGNSVWVSWSGMDVLNHECGHTFGLGHAHSWQSSDGTAYGQGSSVEYGNPFDVMGNGRGFGAHYNTLAKRALGWLPDAYVHAPKGNGVFRLYAYDQPRLEEGKRYSLAVPKDDRWYNIEYHPTTGLTDSALAIYSGGGSGGFLLDVTPGSAGGLGDAGIASGRTFSDLEADMHFTVLGKNATDPPSIDVAFNRGPFPGNLPPILSLAASATTISPGGSVTFTATASDPNGDPLAYQWDFDDGGVGTNNAVFTRSFANVAQVTAMVTVSDMKGAVARRFVVINVGSHGKQKVGGSVTWNGQPLPGVLIAGGGKTCYSDTDGNYALSGIATGSQALTATLNGYTFTPQFTNPLTVIAGTNTANWTAANATNFVTLTKTADVVEGGASGNFRFTRSGDTSAALTVLIPPPAGTATKTADYTFTPDSTPYGGYFTFTIPGGQASLNVTVTPVNDTFTEATETIQMQLASNGTYLSNTANSVVMTLQDNDSGVPVVSVAATDPDAMESPADPGVFTFTRSGSTTAPLDLSVNWQGAAINGIDYTALPSTVTIPTNQSTTTVTVNPLDDSIAEPVKDVTATINPAPNNWVRLVRSGTLITGYRSTDGVTWTVQGSGNVSMPGTVLVGLAVSSNSGLVATASFDNLSLNGVPVSGLTGADIGAAGLGGNTLEVGGGFSVRGSGGDLNGPVDSCHFSNMVLAGDGDIRGRITGLSTETVWTKAGLMIRETTAAGSKYGFMGIGGGADLYDFQFRDTTDGATSVVPVNAINTGAPYVCDMAARAASVALSDNDQPPSVSVSAVDGSASETGPHSGVFLISRTGSTAVPLKVYYGLSGSALHGTDYAALTGEVIIPAGTASAPVVITTYDDGIAEPTETVTLVVTTFNGAYTVGSFFSGTLSIQDNDNAPVVSVRPAYNGAEGGGNGAFYFRSVGSGGGSGSVVVNYTVSGTATAGSDYTAMSGTVTVPTNGYSDVLVPVPVLHDALAEATETVVVTITSASGYQVSNDGSAPVLIYDNDSGATLAAVSPYLDVPTESGTQGAFFIYRNNTTGALPVNYTLSGSATNGVDYAALSGTLVIPDGEYGSILWIAPVDDSLAEGSETVIVSIAPGSGYGATVPTSGALTITDNEMPATLVGFQATTSSTTEAPGALGEYRDIAVTLSAASAGVVTVDYYASGGSATGNDVDWTFVDADAGNQFVPSGTLVFAPGTTSRNIRIRVKNDGVSEPAETVGIILADSRGAGLDDSRYFHLLTITDGPAPPYQARFLTSATTRIETGGSEPLLMAVLDRPAGSTPITVNYTVGGTATAGIDYLMAPGTLTFAAGEQTKPLPMVLLTDSIGESPELITVTLTSAINAELAAPTSHTITLIDADAPVVAPNYFAALSTSGIGTVIGTESATLSPGRTVAGWSIVGGNSGSAFAINASGQITLQVPSALPSPGTVHLVVRAIDNFGATGDGPVTIDCNETSLRAWWKLDEISGTVADDATGNPYDGTLLNAPAWTPGFASGALTFNGTDQSVQVPALGLNTNTLTISAWIKRNGSQSDYTGILYGRGAVASGLGFGANNDLNYTWNNGGYTFGSGLVVPDHTWTFCALVIEPTKATFYMQPDGGPMQTAVDNSSQAVASFNTGIYLGQDPVGGRFFKGQIDDVRVHSRALSASDFSLEKPPLINVTTPVAGAGFTSPADVTINADVSGGSQSISAVEFYRSGTLIASDSNPPYSVTWSGAPAGNYTLVARAVYSGGAVDSPGVPITIVNSGPDGDLDGDGFTNGLEVVLGTDPNSASSQPPPVYSGLSAWWKLDETSGTVADDATGRPQDGTLINAPVWTSGFSGSGLSLNGTNQSVQVPALGLNTNTLTISAWVKRNGAQAGWTGIAYHRGALASGLHFGPSNDLRYTWNSAEYWFSSGLTIPDNTWTFCAVVVEPTKATLYMQPAGGTMQSAVNTATHAAVSFDTVLYLGQDSQGGRFFNGALDDVHVYARSLSGADAGVLCAEADSTHSPVFANHPITGAGATEDNAYSATLASSATDPDAGATLTYTKVTGPAWLNVGSSGVLSGTPLNANVGTNTFTVRVTDNTGQTDDTVLNIAVSNVNDAPVFTVNPIAGSNATEDSAYADSLAGFGTDIDAGDTITYSKVSGPAWLSVASNGALSGTPTNSNVGSNSFAVKVTDSSGANTTATLNIAVLNTNDAPVFTANPIAAAAGTAGVAYSGNLAPSATDLDGGDLLVFSKVSGPAWLNVASSGALSGIPLGSDFGANSFAVKVTDQAGASATATLNITVNGIAWANSAGGSWPVGGNWNAGVIASGTDKIADFSTLNLTANATVALDGARSVGHLRFGDTTPSHNWTLTTGSGGPLTLSVFTGSPLVTVNNQTATIATALDGTSGLIKDGAGSLALNGANTYSGGTVVSGGTLTLGSGGANGAIRGTLTVNSGAAVTYNAINSFGYVAGTSVNALNINGGTVGNAGFGNHFWNYFQLNMAGGILNLGTGGGQVTNDSYAPTITTVASASAAQILAADAGAVLRLRDGSHATFNIADGTPATDLLVTAGITESGGASGIVKTGAGTLTLSGSNSYTGWTTVTAGSLSVTGTIGATATTIQTGATLRGTGTLGGAVTVQSGGTLAPGVGGIGTLTLSSNPLTLSGTAAMDIGRTGSVVSTDSVGGISTVSYGGTLIVTNIGANALQGGDSFRLFEATTYGGSFATVTLPALSQGLNWNTSQLAVNGTVTVTPVNGPPVFTANPVSKPSGIVGSAYSGSLAANATDPNAGDVLTFTKTSGPAWLSVAANGTLSGTPPPGSGGVNTFTVRVTDPGALYADATLNIPINNTLPAGWTSSDIGSIGMAGSAYEGYATPGTYTITGSGDDIWNAADAFRFASMTLNGNGEIRARITSQTSSDPLAKAGVMIRDGTGSGAVNAMVALTPSNGFTFQWRTAAAGASNSTAGPAPNTAPNNWVRLTRSGTLITAYVSANGTTWTQVSTTTLTMATSVSVGLAVTAHNNTTTSTATFDNVTVTPYPSPWLTADVGTTGLQGSAEFYSAAHTVKGAGLFGGTSDGFRYVYQSLSADGSIVARVSTLGNTGTSARVGVMMRDTLANNSRMAALTVTGSGAWRWERRTATGGSVTTTNSSTGTAPNIWVRLVRSGNTVTASRSTNGTSWTTISSATVTMASSCYVGLAVDSGSTTALNTSILDSITVVP
ncbi:MAG: Calx-beta domain-containing protein [Verrucomicrobiota bacterium]